MSISRFSAAAVIALGTATSAYAADPVVGFAPTGFSWEGFYVGAFVGHTFGSDLDANPLHIAAEVDRDIEGFIAGIGGGYRWHFANDVVFGLGLSIPLYAEEGTLRTAAAGGLSYADPEFAYTVNAHLGLAYGQFLPYIHAGIGQTFVEGGSRTLNQSTDEAHLVATVGAGLGYKFTQNWNARIQYNYIFASDEDYTIPASVGFPGGNEFGWDGSSVFVMIEYQFPTGGLF
ncbi:MAG: acyloxyacyl hydrolase [Pseudomonadota bacterium]